ncbi:MAG: RsmB/NOP family class I SAM-dependent RNA methyltransferase [Lachnospiraceae bacterium]|nr:RsmB/NOP family class I SAM-dependent RNA methyltransferase [Lachnospiraceae bacterium]
MLPQDFTERMRHMLGDEFPAFLASYEQEKRQGLRLNPLKTSRERFETQTDWRLAPVLWAEYGYYYDKAFAPGKHPYHASGVYYIQEPSAMAPARYLDAQPGEIILDLCAAPGGKSTQIAGAMRGQGLLICNEIHPARAKILSENIERMGIRNALVTNETPARLAERYEACFDRIMVDAPCSGEGMFRKNEDACEEWSLEQVAICAERQDEILEAAAQMLKPGGRLVYSTCTFAPEENEGSISRFLAKHPEYEILPVKKSEGMSGGRADWIQGAAAHIEDTIRMFPHKLRGEGHYVAVLKKTGERGQNGAENVPAWELEKGITNPARECRDYLSFEEEYLKIRLHTEGKLIRFGDQLYLAPQSLPALKGLKVLRAGLHLGSMKKNRFEPSHALALTLRGEQVRLSKNLASDSPQIQAYLRGQTLEAEGEKGWYLMTTDGYSIGWGKLSGNVMKNHYPKGLRIS